MESNILEKYLENHVLNSWTADSAFMFVFFTLFGWSARSKNRKWQIHLKIDQSQKFTAQPKYTNIHEINFPVGDFLQHYCSFKSLT